jgi:hypothetical protein
VALYHTRKAEASDFVETVQGTFGTAGAADTIRRLRAGLLARGERRRALDRLGDALSKTPDRHRWQGFGEGVFVDTRIVEKCSYCDFTVSAPFEQARQAFEQHVCGRPKVTVSKRRRSGFLLR